MDVIKLNKDDVLILKSNDVMSWEVINNLNKVFESNKIKMILLPNHIDVIGIKYANKL